MRALNSIIKTTVNVKYENKDMDEVKVVHKALQDYFKASLVACDLHLFKKLLKDLFPSLEEDVNQDYELKMAI